MGWTNHARVTPNTLSESWNVNTVWMHCEDMRSSFDDHGRPIDHNEWRHTVFVDLQQMFSIVASKTANKVFLIVEDYVQTHQIIGEIAEQIEMQKGMVIQAAIENGWPVLDVATWIGDSF